MFITKKHIPRREALRGMGAVVALPFLDAMVPAQTPLEKTAATPSTRLCAIEIVHGAGGATFTGEKAHYWVPEKEGPDFEFGVSLKPIEPFREYVTIVSNTDLNGARTWESKEEGADHTRSSAVYLSGAHPKMTAGADYLNGTTIDQIYAQKRGQDTPLPSLSWRSRTWARWPARATTGTAVSTRTLFHGRRHESLADGDRSPCRVRAPVR